VKVAAAGLCHSGLSVINRNRPPISVISSLRTEKLAKVIKFAGLKQK
jgi:hypothetical protein